MMTMNNFNVGHQVLVPQGVCVRTGISTRPVFWVRRPGYRVRIAKIIPSMPQLVVNDVLTLPAVGQSICWWSSSNLYSASIDDILALISSDTRRIFHHARSVPRDLALLALTMGGNDVY